MTTTVEQAPEDAPHGLVAHLVAASEDAAEEKLNDALSSIPHDPYIYWHAIRLTGFVP